MGEPAEKWNKAERLAVAGAVAPHLRSLSERARMRRVARVDRDGRVVGYTTLAEVQKALLEKQKIELEVVEGTRPKEIICERCGRRVKVRKGIIPKTCYGKMCIQATCAGFGKTEGKCKEKPARQAFTPKQVRRRKGAPWRCRSCTFLARMADPAIRENAAKTLRELVTSEEGRARQAERMKNMDPERVRRMHEGRKKPGARKRFLEQRRSPEFRASQSEKMRKAWEKRRAKSATESNSDGSNNRPDDA